MLTRRKRHVCRKLHFQRWFQAYDDLLKRVTTCPEITSAIYLKSSLLSIFSKCDILSLEMLTFGLIQQIFFAFTWLMSLLLNYYQSSWQSEAERLELPLGGFRAGAYSFHFHRKICLTILFVFRMLDVSRWIEDAVGFCFFKWVFNFFKHKSAGTDSYRVPNVSRVSKILHKTNLSPLPQHRRMTEG